MISSYDRGKSPPFLDYNQIENKKNIYRLFYLLLKSVRNPWLAKMVLLGSTSN
jgi:hypothetical protein